jgi:hypothetical protein
VVRRTLLIIALAATSCGQAAGPSALTATPSPASVAASPSASAGAATRVQGKVQSATATKLTLADGAVLDLGASTRITRTDPATPADLKPGLFVAITAKQQPDRTLLASMVSIFAESLSRVVPPGQRPLTEGNLMTNAAIASIDQVSAGSFTVTFAGTQAQVVLAPSAVVLKQTDVKAEEIAAGATISASVVNGVVQSIQIQSP